MEGMFQSLRMLACSRSETEPVPCGSRATRLIVVKEKGDKIFYLESSCVLLFHLLTNLSLVSLTMLSYPHFH